jgi:hypothetical protein
MMEKNLEKELIEETKRLNEKLKKEIERFEIKDENIIAYIKDSEYFLAKGELIKAFEAIIWAWALYEINYSNNLKTKE